MMNSIIQTTYRRRTALTLVELMVVITIVSILAAIALPTIRNTLRDQKIPRSVNLVKAQFELARSNAIRSGRPHGLILRRAGREEGTTRSQSFQLQLCASQPSYSGDTFNAETLIDYRAATNSAPDEYYLWFRPSEAPSLLRAANEFLEKNAANAIVGPGDSVILCGGVGAGGELRVRSLGTLASGGAGGGAGGGPPNAQVAAFLRGENGVFIQLDRRSLDRSTRVRLNAYVAAARTFCFTIYRSPRPSFEEPVLMIDGTTIDLTYSGVGTGGFHFSPLAIVRDIDPPLPMSSALQSLSAEDAANPSKKEVGDFEEIWIVFGPDGRVERVYYGVPTRDPDDPFALNFRLVHDTIYLLVGYAEGVRPAGPLSPAIDHDGEAPNIFRGDVTWIALLAGSGQVTVADITSDDGLTDPNDQFNDRRLDPIPLAEWEAPATGDVVRELRLQNAVAAARENILLAPAGDL